MGIRKKKVLNYLFLYFQIPENDNELSRKPCPDFSRGPLKFRCQYVNLDHQCKFHLNVFGDYQHCWTPYIHCGWCSNIGDCYCCNCRIHKNSEEEKNCWKCCPADHFGREMFFSEESYALHPFDGTKLHLSAENMMRHEHKKCCLRKRTYKEI